MATGVFVLKDKDTLVPMRVATFAAEDDFQHLLASFPELLAGDQIGGATPLRFLLVSREQPISDCENGSGRWALDHLFVDQNGVPTLVEVKRSTDTRIRREVIGQMLDYAANAVAYWPVQALRAKFEARCLLEAKNASEVLQAFLRPSDEADLFWERVRVNLQVGKVRLLFVADVVPSELRRIVEFLNLQMQPAEVLAIELRQYQGEGLSTLVPTVIGQTQAALQGKGASSPRVKCEWDEASILAALADRAGTAVLPTARTLIDWMTKRADRLRFNTNPQWGSVAPLFSRDGTDIYPFVIYTDGTLTVCFEYMLGKPVFGDLALRQELLRRLNQCPGFDLADTAVSKRPTIHLKSLTKEGSDGFIEVMDWFVARLQTYDHTLADCA